MPEVPFHTHRQVSHTHPYAPANHTHGGDPGGGGPHDHDGTYAPVHTHPYAATAHTHPYADSSHAHTAGDAATLDGLDSTAFALADHTHAGGSSAVTVQKVTADQANSTVNLANATGMAFAVAANTAYEFEYLLAITSAALTTGWQFAFTGPAAPTTWIAAHEYQSSATAWTTSTSSGVTYPAFTLVTAAYTITAPILVRIKGVLVTGAASGTLQLQFRSEVAASAITLKRGSTLKYA